MNLQMKLKTFMSNYSNKASPCTSIKEQGAEDESTITVQQTMTMNNWLIVKLSTQNIQFLELDKFLSHQLSLKFLSDINDLYIVYNS